MRAHLGANMPQRYLVNQARYAARGGLLRLPEDMRIFISRESNRADMARFYFFCVAFDQIVKEGLQGDFAELGVFKGFTAGIIATMARRTGSTAYLLDTFAGFNDADRTGVDATVPAGFHETSVEAVRNLIGDQNVKFVPGYFPATASQLPPDAAFSLVHLDCDLYAPMAAGLAYFYPRLVPGGFLIVHDYSSLHWPGAEKAVDEFFATRPEAVVPLPDSAGSVVIRKSRTPARYSNWYVRRNASLFGAEWTPAAHGSLSALLGDGWSRPEPWGVWSINEAHEIFVFLDAPPVRDIVLEFDVGAFLLTPNTPREYGIFVDGQIIQDWVFTAEDNRSIRTLRIPPSCLPAGDDDLPVIRVTFLPTAVISTAELQLRGGDMRRMGLALHRVRRAG